MCYICKLYFLYLLICKSGTKDKHVMLPPGAHPEILQPRQEIVQIKYIFRSLLHAYFCFHVPFT